MTLYLLQICLAGLAQGSLFALAALGLVVIFNASTVVNFAHGAMGMAATYVAYVLITSFHVPFALAFAGAIVAAFVLGIVVQKFLLGRLQGAPVLVTAYYAGAKGREDEGNAVLAEVGRIVAEATAKPA